MLKEFVDFIRYESRFGFKVLFKDLININKLYLQDFYLQNLLNFAKKNGFRFTFFLSAKNVGKRQELIKKMVNDGHEIASHAYNHLLLDRLSKKELINEFKKADLVLKKFKVKGFRPPFLSVNSKVIEVLKEFNFKYISSTPGGKPHFYQNGIMEIPIIKPNDWYGTIVENMSFDDLLEKWVNAKNGVFLFHPWIINNHLNKLKRIFKNKDLRICSNLNNNNIKVSFDVY